MKLLVLSDLHVEFAPFEAPCVDADVIVLAGDIHQGEAAAGWARQTFGDRPIVLIAGNHEFYGAEFGRMQAEMRTAAKRHGVHLLEHDAVEIGGVRFVGCTLWTDFRLYETPGRPLQMSAQQAMQANRRRLLDYASIRFRAADGERGFEPADAAMLHARAREWLDAQLADSTPQRTVVVSHHLPSWQSVVPPFLDSPSNPAFASDLDHLFGRATLWIHGHAHSSIRYECSGTRVVCNPRGYPMRDGGFENPAFDAGLLVEV